jgi:hypothetical protein
MRKREKGYVVPRNAEEEVCDVKEKTIMQRCVFLLLGLAMTCLLVSCGGGGGGGGDAGTPPIANAGRVCQKIFIRNCASVAFRSAISSASFRTRFMRGGTGSASGFHPFG